MGTVAEGAVTPRERTRLQLAWTPAWIVAAVLALYVLLSCLGWLWLQVHHVYVGPRGGPLLRPRGGLYDVFVAPWMRWNALDFLQIAGRGYPHGARLTAFYPGYAGVLHAVSVVLGGSLVAYTAAGIAINLAFTSGALVALHRLVAADLDTALADRVVTYTLLAPMTFFFLAPYSEALFLLLSVVSLLAARRGRLGWAAVAAALAAVTRPPGVLLVVPLAWEVWVRRHDLRARVRAGALLLLPVAAFATWYAWATIAAGESPATAERFFGLGPALPWAGLVDTFTGLARHPAALVNTVAVALTVAAAVLLVRMRGRVPLSYGLWAAVSLVPMTFRHGPSDNPWVSAVRYAAVVFPVYVALALWTSRRPALHRAWLMLSPALLLAAFAVYTYNRFVG
jgi:hypothetical protein